MAKSIDKKLTDSNGTVSVGGRADRFWRGKPVKPSSSYEMSNTPGVVDQFAIIKKYNLKGFEYGNWVNNNDRNDRLTATAESMADLAKIIGSKNIGFDGMVGIAFGARGHSGALAHFEPGTFMINLTKEKGFGSLAHEYGHALDYFFGMYIDQNPQYTSLVGGRTTRMNLVIPGAGTLRKMANDVINAVIDNGKSVYYEKLSAMYDGDTSGYPFRRNEIFARLFEVWVSNKLKSKGIQNTFLSHRKYESGMYLNASEFKRVSPMLDKLIKEMASFMNNKKKSTGITRKTGMKIAARK